ncbi:outer membrane beta-barrel protein [Flavobacterium terrigena]|uniref:Outer membrane protein beta-barrel domain-containing protein n=1 Tax=Flavobacterium terrigena TaxID=402734 RepID=A0A1H6QRH3_9FLAO|nr:outer membrane beta-barrel protein [Flavobacterium terrigena]SEI41835.1 Outer membrane protein beta-barrel domain-containing protein [Flavobacterium terrigena]
MKKALYLFAIILGGITISNAQVTFKPGIRGGLNVSHFSKGNDAYYDDAYYYEGNNGQRRNFESKTSFYIGLFGDLKLTKYYSLQPELNYSRQGSTLNYIDSNDNRNNLDYELSYLSLGVANKFTFNKFNIHVGPTIDFLVDSNVIDSNTNNYYYGDWYDANVDLAFFLGAGYDITKNFGVEARIKKGIIPVLDYSDGNHTNVVFSFGAFYKFDVK